MSNLITNEELSQLPFIALDRFNPDYDETACFTIHGSDFEVSASVTFDEISNRTYRLPTELSLMQRVCALQAIDIMIDESFVDVSSFEEDERPTRIYFAIHSMCCNYGLYSDKGRLIVGFEEQ